MTQWQSILTIWDWKPTVLLGCACMLAWYAGAMHFRLTKRSIYFIAGVAILLLSLVSAIDILGDIYLFSVHMLQHLLMILLVPPLLLLGIPDWMYERILSWPLARKIERVLGRPVTAWFLGTLPVWIWHFPPFYTSALRSQDLHIMQHLTFLVTGTIFWWPVIAPNAVQRLGMFTTMGYLFAASAASSVLGIMLTFASPGLYPIYLNPYDRYGLLPLIRGEWGLSPAADQQLGGLLMWIPGSMAYLGAMMFALIRLFQQAAIADAKSAEEETRAEAMAAALRERGPA